MVVRELGNRLFHELAEMTLPEKIIRAHRHILKLEGAIFIVPVRGQFLEKDERASRPIPQLILGEVAGDRVNPCGELLGRIEPMKMAGDPDEGLLNQILSTIGIASLSCDEVHQAVTVAMEQLLESSGPTIEMSGDQGLVRELSEGREIVGLPEPQRDGA
jgi:hypothetical protein